MQTCSICNKEGNWESRNYRRREDATCRPADLGAVYPVSHDVLPEKFLFPPNNSERLHTVELAEVCPFCFRFDTSYPSLVDAAPIKLTQDHAKLIMDALTPHLDIDTWPSEGLLAGGAVANVLFEHFWGGDYPINDLDIFTVANVDHDRERFNACQRGGEVAVEADNYRQLKVVTTSRGFLRLIRADREGIINTIKFATDLFSDVEEQHMAILRTFDLNCCQVGINLANGELVYTDDFEQFLNDRLLKTIFFGTPMHTAIRMVKKLDELQCDCDLETEMILLGTALEHFGDYKEMSNRFGEKYLENYERYKERLDPYVELDTVIIQWLDAQDRQRERKLWKLNFKLPDWAEEFNDTFKIEKGNFFTDALFTAAMREFFPRVMRDKDLMNKAKRIYAHNNKNVARFFFMKPEMLEAASDDDISVLAEYLTDNDVMGLFALRSFCSLHGVRGALKAINEKGGDFPFLTHLALIDQNRNLLYPDDDEIDFDREYQQAMGRLLVQKHPVVDLKKMSKKLGTDIYSIEGFYNYQMLWLNAYSQKRLRWGWHADADDIEGSGCYAFVIPVDGNLHLVSLDVYEQQGMTKFKKDIHLRHSAINSNFEAVDTKKVPDFVLRFAELAYPTVRKHSRTYEKAKKAETQKAVGEDDICF